MLPSDKEQKRCNNCFQFIGINSLYMFQALTCSSSEVTVYTTTGMFCAYYVRWLLAGFKSTNPARSQPTKYAQNIPTVVHTVPSDDEQISA
jgi:hypothetical protein